MSFLTLNGTTIPCRSNACDVKDVEHRVDRARMFDGSVRMTRGHVYREFTIVTAFQNEMDYAAIRALVNTDTPPLTADGDLIADGPIYVHPVPGSWTPTQTASGFRRQAKFTLMESSVGTLPDTTATPWLFARRGVGYWQDRAGTIPALDGDKVDRWDDASGNGRYIYSHNGTGGDGTGWAGSLDYRPLRDVAAKSLQFGHGAADIGQAEMRVPTGPALFDELEILIGVRAEFDPYSTYMGLIAPGGGVMKYPDTDGHIRGSFGLSYEVDFGDPTIDLTGYNVIDFAGSQTNHTLSGYLNNEVLIENVATIGDFDWDSAELFKIGDGGSGPFYGWMRDIVIFNAIITPTQRLAWYNYLIGTTSTPPLIL